VTDPILQHPVFDLTVQVFRGSVRGHLGTGYLVGPGVIITALHCVVEDVVPAGDVTCTVRLYSDGRTAGENAVWDWVPATLAWPKTGSRVDECDIAVLTVAPQHQTAAMQQKVSARTHIPQRPQIVEGVGYPGWRKDSKVGTFKPHRARGILESDVSHALHDFDIAGSTPPNAEDWQGLSGALLFARDTNTALGVAVARDDSKNNSLLGATLFHKVVADEAFWKASGLPRPTTDDNALRRAAAPIKPDRKLPSDFLFMLDRTAQLNRLKLLAEKHWTASPYPTAVVPIIGDALNDEASLFIQRLESVLRQQFPARQSTYHRSNVVTWVPDGLDVRDSVEQMLHELKGQMLIGKSFDLLADAGPFREALESGIAPRAFRIEVSFADDLARVEAILTSLLDRFKAFGKHDSPLVLFLAINRAELPETARSKPHENAPLKNLAALVPPDEAVLKWLPLPPLDLCRKGDLDSWVEALKQMNNPAIEFRRVNPVAVLKEIYKNGPPSDAFAFYAARCAVAELEKSEESEQPGQ
jgi:hypothetical protein